MKVKSNGTHKEFVVQVFKGGLVLLLWSNKHNVHDKGYYKL